MPPLIFKPNFSRLLTALVFISAAEYVFAAPFEFPGKVIARHEELLAEYDYVVVGGGTSGLVVSNRLTENPESMYPSEPTRYMLQL